MSDYENPKYQVHEYIKTIYNQNYVVDMDKNKKKLGSQVNPREGYH